MLKVIGIFFLSILILCVCSFIGKFLARIEVYLWRKHDIFPGAFTLLLFCFIAIFICFLGYFGVL